MMAKTRTPVLATVGFAELPGCVKRPLVDPVPLSPLAMVWSRGLRHPGLEALVRAADALARARGWLDVPPGSWLPAALTPGAAGG